MRVPIVICLFLAVLCCAAVSLAQPAAPPLRRPPCATCLIVILPSALVPGLPERLNGLEILLESDVRPDALRDGLAAIADRGGRPGLVIRRLPAGDVVLPAGARTVLLDLRESTLPLDRLLFELRRYTTAVRAGAPEPLRIAVDVPGVLHEAFMTEAAAGYWDVVVADAPASTADIWQRGATLTDAGRALGLSRTASERWIVSVSEDAASQQAFRDLAAAARLLPDRLVSDTGATQVRCGTASVPQAELFLDPQSLERVALLASCPPGAPIVVEPAGTVERVQLSGDVAIARLADAAPDRFASDVRVAAARRLSVEEIVARHQAAVLRQAASVRTSISTGTLTITFEAPGFPAPVTVNSVTTIYAEGQRTDLEQRGIRVNGIAIPEDGVPRLPLIEPERAAAPPLTITLGDRYRYRLAGEDTVRGVRAYVVAFEPRAGREPLFRGRAWIAMDDFGLVRVQALQTGLRGPIVSSEQVDDLRRTGDGRWVLERSDIRQLYEGAAYRTPIHRVLVLETHEFNAADFITRRRAAFASRHVMLRDTPAGYRYLNGAERQQAEDVSVEGAAAAIPVSRKTGASTARIRTAVFGLIVDPNITNPLPFAGLSYVNFDLLGTGAQLSAFFGGSYGQLAFSIPSLGGSRWQLAGRAFGIASSFNDRVFVSGREQYELNLRQRPAFGSVWVLRPLTPRVTFRAAYELEYTHLERGPTTADDFTAPASQLAHGLRVASDWQQRGWEGSAWWNGAVRAGWRRWGRPDSPELSESQGDFQRFGATLARSVVFSPQTVARAEIAVSGSRDTDRFSRFSFGTFENRLRGYPTALIRYDRGAVARGTIAWSPGRFVRVDGFADTAVVRDRGFAAGASRFSGIGAAVEGPAPFGTLLAVEWGYGIDGVNAKGRRGTHVVRVSGYKVF